MRYALQKPCEHCPFRNDKGYPFFAQGQRVEDILDGMDYRVFPCHKTAKFSDDGDQIVSSKTQACAGALIMMEKSGTFSSIVQVLTRLGIIPTGYVDLTQPVYDSPQECVRVHDEFGSRSKGPFHAQRRAAAVRLHKWWWRDE